MREDMAEVIVERPRLNPRNARKGRRLDLDDLLSHEGMRRSHAWRGDRKELNENLAPLRRYLAQRLAVRGIRFLRKLPRIFVSTALYSSTYGIICATLLPDSTPKYL